VIKTIRIQAIEEECSALSRALNRVFLAIAVAAYLF